MRITPIQTGTVRIKAAQIEGKGHGLQRRFHTFTSSEWGNWIPIYAWLIEHPEGLFLVDTGETARTMQAGYFPKWHPYYAFSVQMNIQPEDEINFQLARQGIKVTDIRTVILTHLHTDHAGGIAHFSKNEILVTRKEYQAAKGFAGRLLGYLPNRWPNDFKPRLIDFKPETDGPFRELYPITKDGSVLLVPTPGHSAGHASVIVKNGPLHVFIAGDVSYTEQHLLQGTVDGVSASDVQVKQTQAAVRAYIQNQPTIYLPSHDPLATHRLANSIPVPTNFVVA